LAVDKALLNKSLKGLVDAGLRALAYKTSHLSACEWPARPNKGNKNVAIERRAYRGVRP
jgi:hypothetical protein